ncbi:unnamed protein product [Macrosiphum euphorbiae]|uniref:Zinc finger DNA binding protein n=2 Tax=Macrosiphum euphorbiae TaxID=13131 RepID=A0AAV0XZT0_9HEMI|nr:unnamed protein product [Macrosiphum euphorbiae]
MNFHSTCITNSQDGLKKPTRNKDWKCDNCILKIIPDRRNHDKSDLNKDDIKNIKINLNNISFKLDTLSDSINKIDSIEKSISFISSKVDEFNVKFETILSKLKTHEKKNIELEKKCAILEREILSLSRNANTLEQQNLANNIEITGIPKTENESLVVIVNSTSKVLTIKVESNEVVNSYRTKTTKKSGSNVVICFADKNKKDEIINMMKKRSKIDKKPLLACDLSTKFTNQRVFINDQLSYNNKKLRWLAKLVGTQYGFKYTWANSSGVYMRKNDGQVGVKITTSHQLMDLDTDKKISELWM